MDITQFAQVGAKIAELSHKLKSKRTALDALQKEITTVEDELRPLVVEHSKMVAELVGSSGTVMVAAPAAGGPVAIQTGVVNPAALDGIRSRLLQYLERADPGTSAGDVAEALKVDVLLVRQVMSEMARKGR